MARRSSPPILLELDLSHPLVEDEPDDPIGKLRSRGKPRLRPVLKALHEAGDDDRVVGLVAKVGDTSMSLAHAQEIRDAVVAFAASSKPTVAWADTFGESGNGSIPYFLASGFGEVWLQPTGELNLMGVAAEVTFVRGALDKLGVEPQIGQRHEYKNAADRIVARGFTHAHREALDRIAGSAWEQITEAVAKARGLGVDEVAKHADGSPGLVVVRSLTKTWALAGLMSGRDARDWSTASATATRSTPPPAVPSVATYACCSRIAGRSRRRRSSRSSRRCGTRTRRGSRSSTVSARSSPVGRGAPRCRDG